MANTTSPQVQLKAVLRTKLQEFLYNKVLTHLSTQVHELAIKNQHLQGSRNLTFVYRGETFFGKSAREYIRPSELDSSLRPEMDAWLKRREEIHKEKDYVMGYIVRVLNSTQSLPDYLAMLPEALHPPIQAVIRNCPCKNHELPEEKMVEIVQFNQKGIELTKKTPIG